MSQPRKNNQKTWEAEGSKGYKVENTEYVKFATRILRALGRRGAASDPASLAALLQLRAELDNAIGATVAGMKSNGYSWANVAEATGTTREAAYLRFNKFCKAQAESTTVTASL